MLKKTKNDQNTSKSKKRSKYPQKKRKEKEIDQNTPKT